MKWGNGAMKWGNGAMRTGGASFSPLLPALFHKVRGARAFEQLDRQFAWLVPVRGEEQRLIDEVAGVTGPPHHAVIVKVAVQELFDDGPVERHIPFAAVVV